MSVVALVIGAGAVALSIFMIIEISEPFQGFITVSPKNMDLAIGQISS